MFNEREGYVAAKVLEGSGGGVKEAIVCVYCLLANQGLAAFSEKLGKRRRVGYEGVGTRGESLETTAAWERRA